MKKLSFLSLLILVLFSFNLLAADKAAVFPIGAKKRDSWTVAKKIDKSIIRNMRDIKGVNAVSYRSLYSKDLRKDIARCRADLACQKKYSKKVARKMDFFLFSKIKLTRNNSVVFYGYLFDRKYNKLEQTKIMFDEFATADEMAVRIIGKWNEFFKKHGSLTEKLDDLMGEEDDWGEEDSYDDRSSRKSSSSRSSYSSGPSADELIMEGFSAYSDGDLRKSEQKFKQASSRDVVAKKLYKNVREISKYLARATDSVKARRYNEALPLIARAEKLDDSIKELGVKYGSFQKDTVERLTYLEPSPKDDRIINKIHKKYSGRTAAARKKKVAEHADVKKWLNDRILDREKKLKQFDADEKEQAKLEKQKYAELVKKIKDLKYQWEKSDSELEQKIVALENKLTLYEQKEKGIVKGAADNNEKKRLAEIKLVDKKYKALLKKMADEKDAFYKKQKDELEKEGAKVEKQLNILEEKKKKNLEEIKKIDEKLRIEEEKFSKLENSKLSENEATKMKNEDEDRKFKVQVEKEYQKKFDELNKKLQEYDQKEVEEKKKLGIYDDEIEQYLVKNVEIMTKFQDEVNAEKDKVEAEYKKNKETAKADAEKKFNEELEKLKKEKADIEAKIAEKETPKLKKDLKKIDKKIADHEAGKEEFIAMQTQKLDMEYDAKMMQLDMKIVEKNKELQKDNKAFRQKKLSEKKKGQKTYQNFEKRKALFKKSIDNQIKIAQKERDNKLEKRQKERERLSSKWNQNKEKRRKALDRKLDIDIKKKERLEQDNERIDKKISDTNNKWANRSQDIKVKHQELSEKFEKTWKEKNDKLKDDYKKAKEDVETKYAQMALDKKNAQKEMKVKWEEEIQSLNEEKARRKEERKGILETEKGAWTEKQKQWKVESKQRKKDKAQFAKDMKRMNAEDRKTANEKKKEIERRFEDATKSIYEQELQDIKKRFKDEYRITKKREVIGVAASEEILKLKATALAKNGLRQLEKKDILGARRAFAEALFIDRNNQIAIDGIKSIATTAKSLYWEAYGMKETNKDKAKKIFILITKTLMPSNEMFIKAKAALEDL